MSISANPNVITSIARDFENTQKNKIAEFQQLQQELKDIKVNREPGSVRDDKRNSTSVPKSAGKGPLFQSI